jgi:hypothetical protein
VADLSPDALFHHPRFVPLLEGSRPDLLTAMHQHAHNGGQLVCERNLRQDMAGMPNNRALPVALSHPWLKDRTIPIVDVSDEAICPMISEGSRQRSNTDSTSSPTPSNHAALQTNKP